MFCSECLRPASGSYGGGRGYQHPYYLCSSRQSRSCTARRSARADKLQALAFPLLCGVASRLGLLPIGLAGRGLPSKEEAGRWQPALASTFRIIWNFTEDIGDVYLLDPLTDNTVRLGSLDTKREVWRADNDFETALRNYENKLEEFKEAHARLPEKLRPWLVVPGV